RYAMHVAPVARSSCDVAEAVRIAAEEVDARVVIIEGVERRPLIARLRGRKVLRTIHRRLSGERRLIVYA
ncbi:MAG: hypothetical protein ACREQ9_00920, partial [Candidatus Binatia bacterium]